jgi:porphobilinogen deaminase
MLRIAIAELQPVQLEPIQQLLLNHQIPYSLVDMNAEALLRGEVDTVVMAWPDAPLELPEVLVWSALSPRSNAASCLIVHRERMVPKLDFRLPLGAKVAVASIKQQVQLFDYRADLSFAPLPSTLTEAMLQLSAGNFDAVLLPPHYGDLQTIDTEQFQRIELHPSEIVPEVGHGVWGFQALRDDLETRRLLRDLHHLPTAHCCNVERHLLRLSANTDWGITLCAHCTQDHAGNYHVWATALQGKTLRRVQLSNSTFLGLAERIFARLSVNE